MSLVDIPITEYSAGEELPAATITAIAQVINTVLPVGVLIDFFGLESQVQGGMLPCSGKTVGDASSNATARANADMELLFEHLWTVGNADGTLAIYTSAGAGSTFGASAAADWAAHKAIALPDFRGKVAGGMDDMGGTAANVITDADADKVGGDYGEAEHTLTTTEMPAHSHSVNHKFGSGNSGDGNMAKERSDISSTLQSAGGRTTLDNTGGGAAHNNVQPTVFVEKIIWTGATW